MLAGGDLFVAHEPAEEDYERLRRAELAEYPLSVTGRWSDDNDILYIEYQQAHAVCRLGRIAGGNYENGTRRVPTTLMECLAVFLVAIILIGVTMTLASQAQSGADRWRRAFQMLARKHGGRYVSGGWMGRSSVHFRYAGTTVQIDSFSGGRPKRRYLQVHIGIPDPQLRCEAFPRRPGLRENPFRGMGDVTTGASSFDSEYIVRGESAEEVQRFFSDGVQLQMNRIRYVLGNDDVYVSAQRGRLLVKKEFPRHGGVEHIEDLVDWSLELYDQAMLTRSGSIEFVHRQTLGTIDECVCKVCGDELRDDVVLCRRCKTPHHRDCWLYYGACSTYGCREPEFMVPRIARPLGED